MRRTVLLAVLLLTGCGAAADSARARSPTEAAFAPRSGRTVGKPPQGLQPVVFWITDRSHRL